MSKIVKGFVSDSSVAVLFQNDKMRFVILSKAKDLFSKRSESSVAALLQNDTEAIIYFSNRNQLLSFSQAIQTAARQILHYCFSGFSAGIGKCFFSGGQGR